MNWEMILRIGAVVVAALAAIPGIYAIRKQINLEKLQQKKLKAEVESLSADVAAKLIDSAGDLQEIYVELLKELKKQLEEQKVIICRLEIKIEEQNIKIENLCEQVRELGQEPRYTKEK